jgi:hypothetical protein
MEIVYLVNTIATASFRMLSPKTNMYNTGSMSSALKMANVATGSTAETSEPNAKLSLAFSEYVRFSFIRFQSLKHLN